jgi:hypothetical protein
VLVPGVKVLWSVDGASREGPALAHDALPAGVHDVEVRVETSDGQVSPWERLRICVFDPTVKVGVRPASPAAGDSFEVFTELPIGLPDFLAERARAATGCWFSDGVAIAGARGLSASAPAVMRAGTVGVEYQWSFECGSQRFDLLGRHDPKIAPGVSISLKTDRATRGKDVVVLIGVEQAEYVHEVRVRLPKSGNTVVAERPSTEKDPWRAVFPDDDFEDAVEERGDLKVVQVEAMPILKAGDSGVPTSPDDRRNTDRMVRRTVALGDPDVSLELCDSGTDEPLVAGSRFVLDDDCPFDLKAKGQDADDVARIDVVVAVDGVDLVNESGGTTRSAGDRRRFTRSINTPKAGSRLTIQAQAYDGSGRRVGGPVAVDVGLRHGRSVWIWSVIGLCYLGFAVVVIRLTFFNTRLGQEYRWTRDKDGLDPQVQVAGTVGTFGEVRANLWSKAMSVEVPVDAIPGPEGDFKWLFDLRDSAGGALRFSIDRFDNTEGDGYRLNLDKFEHGPDSAGFRLRPPPALAGKRPGHPLFLNFFHQKGAGTRFLLAFSGFVATVAVLAALVWLFMQDWF